MSPRQLLAALVAGFMLYLILKPGHKSNYMPEAVPSPTPIVRQTPAFTPYHVLPSPTTTPDLLKPPYQSCMNEVVYDEELDFSGSIYDPEFDRMLLDASGRASAKISDNCPEGLKEFKKAYENDSVPSGSGVHLRYNSIYPYHFGQVMADAVWKKCRNHWDGLVEDATFELHRDGTVHLRFCRGGKAFDCYIGPADYAFLIRR